MSNSEIPIQTTQHAFLVAWGWFAEHLGLIQQLQAVSLKQKHSHHRPQTKVLEFLVAILTGLQHLQDIRQHIPWIRIRQLPKPGDNQPGLITAA